MELALIYVLSGHLRFVLGDQDIVPRPGEVAAFDTRVPHWFGSTGDAPAEILSIFGRPGEHLAVRTTLRTSAVLVTQMSRTRCGGARHRSDGATVDMNRQRSRLMALSIVVILAGLIASPPPVAAAFGTIDGAGQHREHERITRASLACAGDAPLGEACFARGRWISSRGTTASSGLLAHRTATR